MEKTSNYHKKSGRMSPELLFDGNSTNYTRFEENFKTKLGTITEDVNAYEYVYDELWLLPEWTKIPKEEIPVLSNFPSLINIHTCSMVTCSVCTYTLHITLHTHYI